MMIGTKFDGLGDAGGEGSGVSKTTLRKNEESRRANPAAAPLGKKHKKEEWHWEHIGNGYYCHSNAKYICEYWGSPPPPAYPFPPQTPNPPPPHPHHPPKPPPPPLVDCDASHGDRATGLYQQYNPQCTADEGVPANCVGTEGCQFCHLEESRAAKGGSTKKCSAWVCAKYDVTGCKGIHRNKKAEKKHFDIGDCSNDVGNRNVGRHVFRDWDCASEEGVPSACQKPGKTPCRMCMLKSADDPVKGWPYCPSVVCDDLNIKRHECPGLDYVAKIGKSSKKKHGEKKRDEDEDEDEDEKKHKSKKHSKNKNDLGEDEKTSKRSKKHSKHRDEDEDDDADEKKHKSRKHSKRKDDE